MPRTPTAAELQWEQQQRDDKARKRLEQREWMKSFVLGLALIVVTVAIAAMLATMSRGVIVQP